MVLLGILIGIMTGCGMGCGLIKCLSFKKEWQTKDDIKEILNGVEIMILSLLFGVGLMCMITLK